MGGGGGGSGKGGSWRPGRARPSPGRLPARGVSSTVVRGPLGADSAAYARRPGTTAARAVRRAATRAMRRVTRETATAPATSRHRDAQDQTDHYATDKPHMTQ
ncbi:hypothetical protein CP975_18055 [Streptomyces alboniger]|uniref:Uncharacterized protein n=1 Tax=Streptomyces alboniger TaxID=132473 RepID=A0A5J6HKX3_STRAD|nr:hypothetical protein CP975_18055 [Streptomyces alboniger]